MNNLANILKDQGQLEEAETLLRRAVELRSDFAAAWMNLGVVLSALQRHSEAEKSYLTAVRHRSHFPDCYYNLGNLYLDQKRYDEAYAAWRNATRQRPTHAIAWNNMIVMLDNIGKQLLHHLKKKTIRKTLVPCKFESFDFPTLVYYFLSLAERSKAQGRWSYQGNLPTKLGWLNLTVS